jgi:hypothetical protein
MKTKHYVNIEGSVYSLTEKQYKSFKERLDPAFRNSNSRFNSNGDKNGESWSDLLHWVCKIGKFIMNVESYNF